MRIKPAVIILTFLISALAYGQIKEEISSTDSGSLQFEFPGLSITENIDTLNKIAFRIAKDFPDSCRKLAVWTISMSDSLNYQKGLADGYQNLGDSYFVTDSLYAAMINYLHAMRIYEQIEPSLEQAYLYEVLSSLSDFTGRIESGIRYKLKEIETFKKIQRFDIMYFPYHNIAYYFRSLGKPDSAFLYTDIAMSYADSSNIFYSYNLLGLIYQSCFIESGDTTELTNSIEWFIKGLNSPEITPHLKAAIHSNIFYTYFLYDKKETDSLALYHLNRVIPAAGNSKDAFYAIPNNYLSRGQLLERKGKPNSAVTFYSRCLEMVDSALSNFSTRDYPTIYSAMLTRDFLKKWKSDAYHLLYDVYSTIGDHKKALEYYINYKNASEDIYQEDTKNLVAMLEADSENEKVAKKITLLERDKEINELKVTQSRNLNIGIGAVFVILLLVGILFFRQNKLKNEHKSTLLEQKLLRLQMNPHFIFNALSSIHSLMNPKDVNRASDYLGNFSRLLRSSLESSREDHILLEDEISSLKNYLELQRLRYDEMFDYKVDVDRAIDLEGAVIPPMLIQPFIENAIEHGLRHKEDPGYVQIRFKLDNNKLSCEIEDDGVGREKAWEVEYAKKGRHKSLATEIIRDRIKILNKKLKQKINLDIIDKRSETKQPLGTMVRLDLPYILD